MRGKSRKELIERERVYLIGTSTQTHGGIGYVIGSHLISQLREDYHLIHIVTHCDGKILAKLLTVLKGLVSFVYSRIVYGGKIVHIHSSIGSSFIRKTVFVVFGKLLRCRIIFHIHSGMFYEYFEKGSFARKVLIKCVLRKVDGVVVLSKRWEGLVKTIERKAAPVYIVSNPIDRKKYTPGKKLTNNGYKYLLFLGAIIEAKGVYDIIECLEKILKGCEQVVVTLAGDREIARAKKACCDAGVEKFVEFPGWVSEQQKILLLQRSHVLLLPSYSEGLPLCLLEGVACGIPVVCSNVGGIPDLITHGKNGFLINPGDKEALVSYTLQLLCDENLWQEMHINNVEESKAFDLDEIAQKIANIYGVMKYC